MELRPHQQDASARIGLFLSLGHNPVAQLATGTGKSLIIADVIKTHYEDDRVVWVLTHSSQLVTQNADAYYKYTGLTPGIVCAGLNKSQYKHRVVFGTIQSIINPALAGEAVHPYLIIVDEAHRVSHRTGEAGMYGRLFEHFPEARRLAMTATPWRMDDGLIYGKGKNFWFDERCFKYTVPQAVADGWLSPLIGVETDVQLDLGPAPATGDFNMVDAGEHETTGWMNSVAVNLQRLARKRNHIAVYCPTIASAMRAAAAITTTTGWTSSILTGSMNKELRAQTLRDFKSGVTRVLCSVDTLTTGFDFPALDCIVCLRPTTSSSLWVQIQGRGTRLSPGKKNCLLLDFVGNLQRLGGVDMVETYTRERKGEAVEILPAVPMPPKPPRRELPGVTTLIPLDPMTGEQANDGAQMTVKVHEVSAVSIPSRRVVGGFILLVNYVCTTPENARINGSRMLFPDAAEGTMNLAEARLFMGDRNLAVILPCPANRIAYSIKASLKPETVTVLKRGKYWNVINEQF